MITETIIHLEENENIDKEEIRTFLSTNMSASDVSTVISLPAVRRMVSNNSENVILFAETCCEEIERFVGTFHQVFIPRTDTVHATAAMSGVKVLSRLIPVIYELAPHYATLSAFAAGPFPARVVSALMATLFLPGFTCGIMADPGKPDSLTGVVGACLWYGGLVSTAIPRPPSGSIERRVTVLRCLLTAISGDLFLAPASPTPASVALKHLNSPDCPNTFLLTISATNSLAAFDPVALTTPGRRAALAEQARLALNVLSIALSAVPPRPAPAPTRRRMTARDSTDGAPDPAFAAHFRSLASPAALTFLTDTISRLLVNPPDVDAAFVPKHKIDFVSEVALFFSILLRNAPALIHNIANSGSVDGIVRGLCHIMVGQAMVDTNTDFSVGLAYLAASVLAELSTQRGFCVALNQRPAVRFAVSGSTIPRTATLLDVYMLTFSIVSGRYRTSAPAIEYIAMMSIANAAPYAASISRPCAPIVAGAIIESIVPDRATGRPRAQIVQCTVDVINGVAHHQYRGNAALVLDIVRHRAPLASLVSMSEAAAGRVKLGTGDNDDKWLARLSMDTAAALLNALGPRVAEAERSKMSDPALIDAIGQSTLVGLLPPPPRVTPRRGDARGMGDWIRGYCWSLVLHRMRDGTFDLTKIKMFGR